MLYVIYQCPKDYPDKYVVRLWKLDIPVDPPIAVVDTIEDARANVPEGLYCQQPFPEDDPCIYEVYF